MSNCIISRKGSSDINYSCTILYAKQVVNSTHSAYSFTASTDGIVVVYESSSSRGCNGVSTITGTSKTLINNGGKDSSIHIDQVKKGANVTVSSKYMGGYADRCIYWINNN